MRNGGVNRRVICRARKLIAGLLQGDVTGFPLKAFKGLGFKPAEKGVFIGFIGSDHEIRGVCKGCYEGVVQGP